LPNRETRNKELFGEKVLFLSFLEETTNHVIIFVGRRRSGFLLLLTGGGGSGFSSSGGGSGGGLAGLDAFDEFLTVVFGEDEVGGDGGGEEVLEAVGDGVGEGEFGGDTRTEGQTGEVGDTLGEGGFDGGFVELQVFGGEEEALFPNTDDFGVVEEGRDLELAEEGGDGGVDLVTGGEDLLVGHDGDGTLVDLGDDVEGLEEGGHGGFHTSVTGGDDDFDGGDGTNTGGGLNAVLGEDGDEFGDGHVGEAEGDVTGEEVFTAEEFLHLLVGGSGVLGFSAEGDDLLLGGLLTDDDFGLGDKITADSVHLLGGDVVELDEDHAFVGIDEAIQVLLHGELFARDGGRHVEEQKRGLSFWGEFRAVKVILF